MKKTISIELELTEAQLKHWNELLIRIKDTLVVGPKEGFRGYVHPPKEFVNIILDIPLPKIPKNRIKEDVQLFESVQGEDFVSPLEVMRLLRKERGF